MGDLIRVFVAVPIPEEIKMALAHLLEGVELPGKPVPPANWHLTLRFLGSIDQVTFEKLLAALDQGPLGESFPVELGGLGAFPRGSKATVLWVGLARGQEEISDLAATADIAARQAGLAPEERPFRPHLTLSRIRPHEDVTSLLDAASSFGLEWRCRQIVVYRSHLGGRHPTYEPLEVFDLAR